ncbi:hypothetical protein SBADM41S_04048 [Streptomyces badius]
MRSEGSEDRGGRKPWQGRSRWTRARNSRRPGRCADARRNHDRLIGEARRSFAEHGTDASLEDIARRAGVGIGTLYRHFPNRDALMNAVFQDARALDRSRELAAAEAPCRALVDWLGAIVTHAGEYRGLAHSLTSASRDATSALVQCHLPLREAGAGLLRRAQEERVRTRRRLHRRPAPADEAAIALAAEQSPDDPELAVPAAAADTTGAEVGPGQSSAGASGSSTRSWPRASAAFSRNSWAKTRVSVAGACAGPRTRSCAVRTPASRARASSTRPDCPRSLRGRIGLPG